MSATVTLSTADIWANPNWVPYAFDDRYERLQFVSMGAEALRSAPFLDDRSLNADTPRAVLPVTALLESMPAPAAPPPAIFHSAFCCSTLFARSLDRPGTCLALKEPFILMSLANARRMLPGLGKGREIYNGLFSLVMTLLKRVAGTEALLLKPTNTANNLLPDWLEAGAPVLLMHASLEDFLLSVLKKGEACKSFVRTQYNVFTLDGTGLSRIPERQAMTFTDLQVAALVWRHQLEGFGEAKRVGRARVHDILDKDFLANPAATLMAAVAALGLQHRQDDIEATLAGGVLERDVKREDQALNAAARAEQAAAVKAMHAGTVGEILGWAQSIRLDGDILQPA